MRRSLTGFLSSLLIALALAVPAIVLTPAPAAAQDALDQIKGLYREGLELYDFFEYQDADKKFDEAIELAKANNINDPIVGKVYLAKGILFHAQFKDTAPQVAYDKTRDSFISAVSNDYDIEIPEDYYTVELQGILDEARNIVPAPDGGGTTNNGGGTTTTPSGSVALKHNPLTVADACAPLEVVSSIPPHPDAFRAYVHYRSPDAVTYETVELMPDTTNPESFTVVLPAEALVGPTLDYYVEVVNRQQSAVASAGSRSQPLQVAVIGECEVESDEMPLVHVFVGVGTGFGLANGDAERCQETPDCYGDDPSRFEGVKSGMASSPLHLDLELAFNVIKELQLGLYTRLQLIQFVSDDPAFMIGAKARYFILADQPHRLYTGLGVGYGDATYIVDLGPEFNNFRDVVRAKGPAHIGLNLGYAFSFHDNVGVGLDLYAPIHFPEFTFHLDLSAGPFFQF